jgi:hypothetical protein
VGPVISVCEICETCEREKKKKRKKKKEGIMRRESSPHGSPCALMCALR